MPIVASVLTTIHITAALALPLSADVFDGWLAVGSNSALSTSLAPSRSSMGLTFTKLPEGLRPPFFSSSKRSASDELVRSAMSHVWSKDESKMRRENERLEGFARGVGGDGCN